MNPPLSSRRWIRIASRWLPVTYGLVFLVLLVPEYHRYSVQQRAQSVHDANFGVWRATSFTVADPSRPLLTRKLLDDLKPDAEQYRWKRLIFDANQSALLQFSSGEWDFEKYQTQANPAGEGTQTILTEVRAGLSAHARRSAADERDDQRQCGAGCLSTRRQRWGISFGRQHPLVCKRESRLLIRSILRTVAMRSSITSGKERYDGNP
jgi:hypothetical protein